MFITNNKKANQNNKKKIFMIFIYLLIYLKTFYITKFQYFNYLLFNIYDYLSY